MRASHLRIALLVLWAAFFCWYTSFRGPLGGAEIEEFVARMERNGVDPERVALWRGFMESDTGDDFAVVNFIDFKNEPDRIEGVGPDETTEEVVARYTRPFFARMAPRATHPVVLGSAAHRAIDLWGIEGAEEWTYFGMVRYRSRRDLMEVASTFSADASIHDFKIAAIEKTVAFPIDPWFQLGDPRLVLAALFGIVALALPRGPARC
jgi:hypothetical protein